MSGTFGYDGYIYQTNVALFLALEKMEAGNNLDKIVLEVRKLKASDHRKNDFTVDLLIYYSNHQDSSMRCDVVEIKGGRQSKINLDDVCSNLDKCEKYVLSNGNFVITQKLVLRKQKQNLSFGKGVVQIIEDNVANNSDSFSDLENKTIKLIKSFLDEFVGSAAFDYYSKIVFYSLRHLVEFEITKLAYKISNDKASELESSEITIENIFIHNESFVHTLQNWNKYTKSQALFYLNARNRGEEIRFNAPLVVSSEAETL